jgi:hypothetical protein
LNVGVLLAFPCAWIFLARIGRSQSDIIMVSVAGWFQNVMKSTCDKSFVRHLGERDAGSVTLMHARWQ